MRNPCLFFNLLIASISVSCFPFSSSTPGQPSLSREQTVKTQIFLDSKGFGPGVVDGKPGKFTRKALAIYRQANSLPDNWTPPVESIEAFTRYTISSADVSTLGTMANEPADMAKLQRLPYESVLELLSERFHTTQTYLRQLNPGTDMENLPAGTTIIAPNVANPFRVHDYPSRYPAASSASAAQRQVIVDIQYRMLQVRQGSTILAAFPITPGSAEHPAPVGEWKIVGAVPYPWFRYDEGVLKRGERTETYYNLPPGPNSPVGILWAGLNRPGIGIHGSPTPDTIGRAGSHGCIRLSNWDAATFRTLVNKGTKVTIR
jgi:lipoprotein-anchoring transpeptidase ErfK/SrfK